MSEAERISAEFADAASALDTFRADPENARRVADLARVCADSVRAGGKILAIGNGGSCADAMHFCEELTGRYRDDRPPIPAIACIDPGHLTCVANDYGFDAIFSRWVEGLGREGDVLVALSTSGNSENIIRAVKAARSRTMRIALLLGKGGGALNGAGDFQWIAPGATSDRIQEVHMLLLHALVGAIERALR
ncbi:MAG: SIS domain-containing protein [Phycisphaerales bacterium]